MSKDLRLSVSKYKTFDDCKAKYNYSYNLKLPKKDWEHHIFGKFCHQVLEYFHQSYIDGNILPYNECMSNSFKAAWKIYKEKMTPEMKKECWDILNLYLIKVTQENKKNLPGNVFSVEKNFELLIGNNVILNGMIDRLQIDDDNVLHVADYKTTKNKKYLKNDWFQLLTYAYIMLQEDPNLTKVRASYILLRHDFEYITTEFSVPEILSIKDKYLEGAEKILSEKEYTPNPTALCSYCDFLDQCPAGKSKAYNQVTYGEVAW